MIPIRAKCSICGKSEGELNGRIFDGMGQGYDPERRNPVPLYCWDHYWKNVVGIEITIHDPFLPQINE